VWKYQCSKEHVGLKSSRSGSFIFIFRSFMFTTCSDVNLFFIIMTALKSLTWGGQYGSCSKKLAEQGKHDMHTSWSIKSALSFKIHITFPLFLLVFSHFFHQSSYIKLRQNNIIFHNYTVFCFKVTNCAKNASICFT